MEQRERRRLQKRRMAGVCEWKCAGVDSESDTRACLRAVAGEEVCSADGEWKASEERDACGGDASVQVCIAESSREEHAGDAE